MAARDLWGTVTPAPRMPSVRRAWTASLMSGDGKGDIGVSEAQGAIAGVWYGDADAAGLTAKEQQRRGKEFMVEDQ